MNRIEGSGQPRSITIYENTNLIEELICSQEEALHTHTQTHTHTHTHTHTSHFVKLLNKLESVV